MLPEMGNRVGRPSVQARADSTRSGVEGAHPAIPWYPLIAHSRPDQFKRSGPSELIIHPELEAEQHYLDLAHDRLDEARELAKQLASNLEVGAGGTNQARFEREAFTDNIVDRLSQLDIGDASLVFGRIDHDVENHGDTLYIGRVGVWDRAQDPVVVDWRAPAAEPFYRATGSDSFGLERRRHFATRGRTLLGIDDEFFGDLARLDQQVAAGSVQGHGALISALETARTGRLGDIAATIQGEQDQIIRAPMPGLLIVQGGPGTGKTVVALHRAAYLLYTHRFPLQDQGVLVLGPNRLFLAYIEQVLPSLGEAGVRLAVLADLVVPSVRTDRLDGEVATTMKGDLRMVELIGRAVRQRQRPIREDLVVGYGLQNLRLTRFESEQIIKEAQRRFRTHNAARKFIETEVFAALAASSRERDPVTAPEARERLRWTIPLRETLEWMWPVLAPAQLLHDLFGHRSLLNAAGRGLFTKSDLAQLAHDPNEHTSLVVWAFDDAPLLDEARSHLGARPGKKGVDEVRTYGHIVIDEAQDLSPMALRMVARRSLNGSMTIVGDIAQSTGSFARDSWEELIEHFPQRREPRRVEMTTGYRIPAPSMALAAKVLRQAAPELKPPTSIREQGDEPRLISIADLGQVDRVIGEELAHISSGNLAVVVPRSLHGQVADALAAAGREFGGATRSGLNTPVTLVPVQLVKGLEVDAVVVVEPARIIDEETQGMRALYVALTRATKRVAVVHTEPLPTVLADS